MKKLLVKILVLWLWVCAISAPILVYAANELNASLSGSIVIEIIDGRWLNGNNEELTKLDMPQYLSAGERLKIGDGLKIKNTGDTHVYARVKATQKLEGNDSNVFDFTYNENWIKGDDGYYYYSNVAKRAVVDSQEILVVIEQISLSTEMKNSDKNKQLSISLTMEVASINDWKANWDGDPPKAWLDLAQQ